MSKNRTKEYNNGIIQCELFPNQKSLINGIIPHHLISAFYGSAGKAKDFMQLYYAVKAVLNKEYEKVIVVKPITYIGAELGYLAGSLEDKTSQYKKSFIENLEVILGKSGAQNFMMKPTDFNRWKFKTEKCDNQATVGFKYQ